MRLSGKKLTKGVGGADALGALLIAALLSGCAGARPAADSNPPGCSPAQAADAGPRVALQAFLAAANQRDFESAYRLLSGRWRARYTPARFATDFQQATASAQEKLARAAVAADGEPSVEGDLARFPVGGEKSVQLVKEPGGWKVDSLE
jgi:hypothetical protein